MMDLYQPELANNICAGATVIHFPQTDKFAELTWVEKSDHKTATNYRGEILGAIATQLLIKCSVNSQVVQGHLSPRIGCDNMGIVKHGNSPLRPLSEKQSQADLLRYFKHLIAHSRFGGSLHHVQAHSDKHTRRVTCPQIS
jgi:hypothetical protein